MSFFLSSLSPLSSADDHLHFFSLLFCRWVARVREAHINQSLSISEQKKIPLKHIFFFHFFSAFFAFHFVTLSLFGESLGTWPIFCRRFHCFVFFEWSDEFLLSNGNNNKKKHIKKMKNSRLSKHRRGRFRAASKSMWIYDTFDRLPLCPQWKTKSLR